MKRGISLKTKYRNIYEKMYKTKRQNNIEK